MRHRARRSGPRLADARLLPQPNGSRRFRALLALSAAGLLTSILFAGPVLRLKDGRQLAGLDLHPEGDLYLLEIAGGSMIPVPRSEVVEVKWVETGSAGPGAGGQPIANMVTGKTAQELQDSIARHAQNDADEDARQAAMAADDAAQAQAAAANVANAQVVTQGGVLLAGPDVVLPTAAQQLAVFGEPAKFAQDVVHFDGGAPSYWIMDPKQAEGSPSVFTPTSPNAAWVPKDGFAK